MMPLSALKRVEATFITAAKKMLNRRGASTHPCLDEASFHSKPPRAHSVVEPHACWHAIVELTNDRDHILWHVKMGEYCPEGVSINGVVRFGKVDKAYKEWNSFLPRQLLQPTNYKRYIGGRTVRSETTMFLQQDPHALTVLAEVASDVCQQYLAGVRFQRDAPVFAALCPILLLIEYHDNDIFPLLRHLPPPPIRTTISSNFRRRAGSPSRLILNSSTETPSDSTAFPFANERMASVSSCIVGLTPTGSLYVARLVNSDCFEFVLLIYREVGIVFFRCV